MTVDTVGKPRQDTEIDETRRRFVERLAKMAIAPLVVPLVLASPPPVFGYN